MRTASRVSVLMALVLVAQGAFGAATPVEDILYARPFALIQGYRTAWQRERPLVTQGYIVVLRADPTLAQFRAGATPVLYGGEGPIERLDPGYSAGIVVGILRGGMDLTVTPIWFGAGGYPGETTNGMVEQARQDATLAGVAPLAADRIAQALAAGGGRLQLATKAELLEYIKTVINQYCPDE